MFTLVSFFFFFKQKTAYEMRISDWSSDVCSSDLSEAALPGGHDLVAAGPHVGHHEPQPVRDLVELHLVLEGLAQRLVDDGDRPHPSYRLLEGEIGRASCRERVCQYG